jgi:hypothetical protein
MLFDYGFEKGREGYPWAKVPPGYTVQRSNIGLRSNRPASTGS